MHTPQTEEETYFREYYIVFNNSDRIHEWMRKFFTRDGFEHCSIYVASEGGTLCISQNMDNIEFYTWPVNVHRMMEHFAKDDDCTVLYLPIIKKLTKLRAGIIAPTCVSLCQRITGLTFHAFTPYAYYRALLKHGAHQMGKPKVDNSLMQEQLAMQKKQQAEAEKRLADEKAATEDLRNRQRRGRKSLLGDTGDELGVI